jgi:hypothetical protein
MTRITVIAALLTGILSAWIVLGFAQEDMREVDNSVFERPVRSPALFDHDVHNDIAGLDDCSICHHVYENGRRSETQSSEGMMCADCHSLSRGAENPIPLRRAFHLSCKGCHVERRAGPLMCAECHPRR